MSGVTESILKIIAKKLSVKDDMIITKSDELLRLLQLKITTSTLKSLNEYSKAVICLDLASSMFSHCVDLDNLLKLSGLKKSVYINGRNTVKKILNLEQTVSISDLCIQFGCTTVAKTAQDLFEKYKSLHTHGTGDFQHPQYVCISVYTACRFYKIKVQKSKFIEISRLKTAQWNKLETEFMKFAESFKTNDRCNSQTKISTNEFLASIENNSDQIEESKETTIDDNLKEDYETWKARILAHAFNHPNE